MSGTQSRSVFFFYYACSFIVFIETHPGAHTTYCLCSQRELVRQLFLIDPKLIETPPLMEGLNVWYMPCFRQKRCRVLFPLFSSSTGKLLSLPKKQASVYT